MVVKEIFYKAVYEVIGNSPRDVGLDVSSALLFNLYPLLNPQEKSAFRKMINKYSEGDAFPFVVNIVCEHPDDYFLANFAIVRQSAVITIKHKNKKGINKVLSTLEKIVGSEFDFVEIGNAVA